MKMANLRLCLGTGSGTLLSTAVLIGTHDLLKTALLAAIGAVVSFTVSWVLLWAVRRKR